MRFGRYPWGLDGASVAEGSHEAISPVTANKQELIVLWVE